MEKNHIKKLVILSFLIIFTLSSSGFGCRNSSKGSSAKITTIKMWGVFDNSNEIHPFIKSYKAKHPDVNIDYQKKSFSEYESILLNGLAEDAGPDIFVMHNTWLPKYVNKISPAPDDLVPMQYFLDSFVTVAQDDLTKDNKIYALPLYVDTLAMYYNHDHYKATKNGKPSNTWADFTEDIERLNQIDPNTKILKRSAIALGTENNIGQAVDVIFQLFLQYNTAFYNNNMSRTAFSSRNGLKAFNQYLSYSNPKSPNYSWNQSRPDDVYEFVNGKVSTIIGYSYLYEQIAAQSRTKGLDFRVAEIPQIDASNPVNYADYWAYTVKKMPESEKNKMRHAWNFLKDITSENSSKSYNEMTHRAPARITLLDESEKDPNFGIFAKQVRYAKSIKNFDRDKYNDIFENAIEDTLEDKKSPSKALKDASEEIDKIVGAYQ